MTPADLFRVEMVGATAWSPDGRLATVEIRQPGRWLEGSIPTHAIRLLDVERGTLATLRAPGGAYIGYFGASWSPNGRRLVFFSVDTLGVARPWTWDVATRTARPLSGLAIRNTTAERAAALWTDDDHALFLATDSGAAYSGALYARLGRGRNAAGAWRRDRAGEASVIVLESGSRNTSTKANASPDAMSRVVAVDLRGGTRRTLARGAIHRLRLSPDRTRLAFFEERPVNSLAPATSFFTPSAQEDDSYDRVNWGGALRVIDVRTGTTIVPATALDDVQHESFTWLADGGVAIRAGIPERRWMGWRDGRFAPIALSPADTARPPRDSVRTLTAPPAGARLTSRTRDAGLYIASDDSSGTRLWLASADGRAAREIWRGNAWVREVRTGHAMSVAYTATDGTPLTGWVLLPPGYVEGARIPMITVVYPSQSFTSRAPPAIFSLLAEHFEHPQLFAARGYGVIMPSMPEREHPFASNAIEQLPVGVMPLLDTLVARGIADSSRIGLIGQSAGGFATLALVTESGRFRTAIASAGYSDLVSLYGTFYGNYRYGDTGPPLVGQLFRMLQTERGYFGAGATPWEKPELYRANSALLRADRVRTPVMLVHGDQDFIPVQQAEEFFTALYRHDRRARLVRYTGEWHTIASRANVLDLWTRIDDWLRETMPTT